MDKLVQEVVKIQHPRTTFASKYDTTSFDSDEDPEGSHHVRSSARSAKRKQGLQTRLQRILFSNEFDMAIGIVIVLNSVSIGVEQSLSLSGDSDTKYVTLCEVIEHIFLVIYILELGLRFAAVGSQCLQDTSVRFDCFLVTTGVITNWIIQPFMGRVDKLGPILVLRTARLFRLARMVRLLVNFRELWMLARGFIHSIRTMFYTMLLLFLTLYVFSSIAIDIITNHNLARGTEADPRFQAHVEEYFADLPLTMLTLLQFVCMDGAALIYKPLIKLDWKLAIYFISIILIISIVLMNLVTAVLVNSALEQTNQDKEAIKAYREKERQNLVERLTQIFKRLDTDGSGYLTREEIMKISEEDKQIFHETLAFGNPIIVFDALDADDSGYVSVQEFCDGIWNVAISNSPIEIKRMEKQVDHIRKQLIALNLRLQDSRQWKHNTNSFERALTAEKRASKYWKNMSDHMKHTADKDSTYGTPGSQVTFEDRMTVSSQGSMTSVDKEAGDFGRCSTAELLHFDIRDMNEEVLKAMDCLCGKLMSRASIANTQVSSASLIRSQAQELTCALLERLGQMHSAIADSFFTACQDACTIPHDRPVPSRESREETAGAHCPEPDDLDCRTISQNIRGMAFRTSTDVFRSLHLSQLLVEPPRPQSPDGEINPQKNVTKFDSPTTCEEAPCSSSKTDGGSPISPDAVLPRLSENLSPRQPPASRRPVFPCQSQMRLLPNTSSEDSESLLWDAPLRFDVLREHDSANSDNVTACCTFSKSKPPCKLHSPKPHNEPGPWTRKSDTRNAHSSDARESVTIAFLSPKALGGSAVASTRDDPVHDSL